MSPRRAAATAEPVNTGSGADDSGLDGGVLLAGAVLISMGVVMSYSGTAPLAMRESLPPLFLQHLKALVAGLALAAGASFVPLRVWHRCAMPLWAVGVLLLLATFLFGETTNGAQRWLTIPGIGFRFQPVEPVKCATLLAVAATVARQPGRQGLSRQTALFGAAIAIVPVVLLLSQPDFGNAVLLTLLVILLLVVAGTPIKDLAIPSILLVACIPIYLLRNPYALRRIVAFQDPYADPQGAGFQLIQSFVAFSKGGLLGVGLGNGRQKLFYLPEAHTDFILALVAEELGLLGVLVVLGAFAALLVAGVRIARRSRKRFAVLVAFAMTTLLTIPAIINGAVVMGLMPTKGLTLPFLSYGGTSLVMCCIALGILLGIARGSSGGGPEPIDAKGNGVTRWR
jgi:cell division protein FtsW